MFKFIKQRPLILRGGTFFKINKTIGNLFEVKGGEEEKERTKLLIRRILEFNSV